MKIFMAALFTVGIAIGLWSMAALVSGVIAAGGPAAFVLAGMNAIGLIGEIHTMVGFYSHIKGIEYLICVGFFVAFPTFATYLERTGKKAPKKIELKEKQQKLFDKNH